MPARAEARPSTHALLLCSWRCRLRRCLDGFEPARRVRADQFELSFQPVPNTLRAYNPDTNIRTPADNTTCVECSPGRAGALGNCERCPPAAGPSPDRTECLACNPPSVCPPELKVRTPAHAKQLGWYVEFESRVTQAVFNDPDAAPATHSPAGVMCLPCVSPSGVVGVVVGAVGAVVVVVVRSITRAWCCPLHEHTGLHASSLVAKAATAPTGLQPLTAAWPLPQV